MGVLRQHGSLETAPVIYERFAALRRLSDAVCRAVHVFRAHGNFGLILGPFLAHSQLQPSPYCPCAIVFVLSMLIGS